MEKSCNFLNLIERVRRILIYGTSHDCSMEPSSPDSYSSPRYEYNAKRVFNQNIDKKGTHQ
jgi:hypothetical protein